jgi:hypothetical protein
MLVVKPRIEVWSSSVRSGMERRPPLGRHEMPLLTELGRSAAPGAINLALLTEL